MHVPDPPPHSAHDFGVFGRMNADTANALGSWAISTSAASIWSVDGLSVLGGRIDFGIWGMSLLCFGYAHWIVIVVHDLGGDASGIEETENLAALLQFSCAREQDAPLPIGE